MSRSGGFQHNKPPSLIGDVKLGREIKKLQTFKTFCWVFVILVIIRPRDEYPCPNPSPAHYAVEHNTTKVKNRDSVPAASRGWRSAARSSSSPDAGTCWRGWGKRSAPGTAGSSAAAAGCPSPSYHFWSEEKRGTRGVTDVSGGPRQVALVRFYISQNKAGRRLLSCQGITVSNCLLLLDF